jgi:6-phosphogluconolactonase
MRSAWRPQRTQDRNLTRLRQTLLDGAPIAPEHIYAVDVESPDPEAAAKRYPSTLRDIAGSPPVLDLVHLGLGPDAILHPSYRTILYSNYLHRIINRARAVFSGWSRVVRSGEILVRLRSADPSIPAGRVRQDHAVIFADRAATEVVTSKQSGLLHSTSQKHSTSLVLLPTLLRLAGDEPPLS